MPIFNSCHAHIMAHVPAASTSLFLSCSLAESDESFDASNFTYNIPDPDDDMCSDTSTSGTDDHQEVFEELADKYRFQVP